jgi:hypothetical protein
MTNQDVEIAWFKLLYRMALSIAWMEGYFRSGTFQPMNTIAYRNMNPGNLRSWGSNPVVQGYAKFPTESAGWNALYSQISKNIQRDLTMNEFFGGKPGVYPGYAPAADRNRPDQYAAFVAKYLPGYDPRTRIIDYFWSNIDRLKRIPYNP